jgi:hypothetical protein
VSAALAIALSLTAKIVARGLRRIASLLDPAGIETLDVHVDAGSPEQCERLPDLVESIARDARGTR